MSNNQDDNTLPLSVDEPDAPFGGPDPNEDQTVSTMPQTDDDIDAQELYDAGLASVADISQPAEDDDSGDVDLPSGFHIE